MKTPDILQQLARDQQWEAPPATNLMARAGSAKDVAACQALLRSLSLPYPEGIRRVLPEMWRALLLSDRLQLFLVENRNQHRCPQIVSFNATVFVTDLFCCEAQSILPPYLGVQIAGHYLSDDLPVLSRREIAWANAHEGLNVMLCFQGWENDAFSPEQSVLRARKQSEAFHLALSGYTVKAFLADAVGEETLQWMLDAGAHLRRDYSDYFQKKSVPLPQPSQRPYLVGLTREEALLHPGSHLAALFVHTPPRFHFTWAEQVLLQHALMGETCEDLAASLSLSGWTVKKRWHAIYERVADIDRDLLPSPITEGAHATSRGAERRRHLLNYLRQHPEELRPVER